MVESNAPVRKYRMSRNFCKTQTGPRGGEKNCFWRGKTHRISPQKFLRPRDTYKKYILQKNWVKTVIPAFSSGQSNLPPSVWGPSRQLDDQHRNTNMNNKDHLVGRLTKKTRKSDTLPTNTLWINTLWKNTLWKNWLSVYSLWENIRQVQKCKSEKVQELKSAKVQKSKSVQK